MKFFSRKALIASATAVAVAFGGASVASAQDNTETAAPTAANTPTGDTTNNDGAKDDSKNPETDKDTDDSKKPETDKDADDSTNPETGKDTKDKKDDGSSISKEDRQAIRDWIAIFTAVIGALGTLLAFLGKYFDLPF